VPVYEFDKTNDLALLHDQLISAGLTPARIEGTGSRVRVEYDADPSGGEAAVAAVVDAHNPGAKPPDPLEAHLARLNDGTPLTAAEIRQTLRFILRRLRGLRE
jgi:hypothetical protein